MTIVKKLVSPYSYVGMKEQSQVLTASLSKEMRHNRLISIKNAVIEYYGITDKQFTSKERYGKYVLPRQVFCYLAKILTQLKYGEISAYIKRDRTTAIYSIELIAGFVRLNHPPEIIEDIKNIQRNI